MGNGQVAQRHRLFALAEHKGGNVRQMLAHLLREDRGVKRLSEALGQGLTGFLGLVKTPKPFGLCPHVRYGAFFGVYAAQGEPSSFQLCQDASVPPSPVQRPALWLSEGVRAQSAPDGSLPAALKACRVPRCVAPGRRDAPAACDR